MNNNLHINSVLGDLKLIDATVNMSDMVLTVYQIFKEDVTTPGVILLRENQFYGLLSKVRFFEIMSRQFMYDLYSKRSIDNFFKEENTGKYLILNHSTSIIAATNEALNRTGSEIFEPIVVIYGKYGYRLLDFYQLLLAQNRIQLLMNELLSKANEFKKEVLAIVTHDLRNPISTILGFSDLISNIDNLNQSKEFALHIHKTANQMEELVNSFLVSTINDSIDYKLEFSNFNIVDLLISAIKDFEYTAAKKNQKILFESSDSEIDITSDQLKIKEVFDNLISNAIKYSEVNTEIRVILEKNDQFILLSFIDQGPGFSKSDLEKVFGKYQKLSARPTANESSTGLGLFIIKKIIDKINGSIDIVSEQGIGTSFIIRLPVQKYANNFELVQ